MLPEDFEFGRANDGRVDITADNAQINKTPGTESVTNSLLMREISRLCFILSPASQSRL
jgi:hypothetical protein